MESSPQPMALQPECGGGFEPDAQDRRCESHDPHALPTDLPRIGSGTVCVMALLVAALLGGLFLLGWMPRGHRESQLLSDAEAVQNARPVVEVSLPKRSSATTELVLPGDVRAMQETAIYPRASGYLKRLLVDVGDRVEAGQLLAEIDTPEVDAELTQARALLEQSKANANKTQVDLDLAQKTLRRFEELAQTNAVAQQQIDEKRSAFDQARAAAEAAKATVAAAQATVGRLTTLQGFEKVVAAFTGTITVRNYDVGTLLSASNTGAGKELFRLEQIDTLRVFVNVPQTYVTMIKKDQVANLTVRNFPGRQFAGKVVRSNESLDAATRTLRFEVDVPNADRVLHAGMYGQVTFQLRNDMPPLTVPTSALVFGGDGTKVAVVQDGKVHLQQVTVGRDLGTEVEVPLGLSGEELVVANPDERITEGAEVQVGKAAPSGPARRAGEPPQAAAR
ncbi:MAG: efflux RND transporter periplasmic adaptor subunit [Bacillota bacterium]